MAGGAGTMSAPSGQSARVAAIAAPTEDVRVLSLATELGSGFAFRAGQYVRLGFGDLAPRDFSLANQPSEALLEFHIRVSGSGDVANYLRSHLAEGDTVSVEGPFGDAYLRPSHPGPILAIAGGTGMVPAKSITATALAAGVSQSIHFYLGARSERDLYPEPEFLEWEATHQNFKFVAVLSEPEQHSRRRRGYVADAVAEDFDDLSGFKCYIAGPPPMVAASVRLVAELGVAPDDIHADPFVPGDHHSGSKTI